MNDTKNSFNIGNEIKKFRKLSDIKQEVFAKDLNVSKSCLSLYENQKREITFNTFIDILKIFKKYNKKDVILEFLDNIREEVLNDESNCLEERIDIEVTKIVNNMNKLTKKIKNFENKGYSRIENVEFIADIFFPQVFNRYGEYYVKNFKAIDETDVAIYFMNHDFGNIIGVFADVNKNKYISKEEFEYELNKEDENNIKYNGNIPKEELFVLGRLVLFPNDIDLTSIRNIFDSNFIDKTIPFSIQNFSLLDEIFESNVIEDIMNDFNEFTEIYN